MAEEELSVGDELIDSTGTQIGVIGSNMADTAGELGALIKEGILSKLDPSSAPVASSEPESLPKPPDVQAPEPPAKAHEVLKEAAAAQSVPSAADATTLHEQLEQAKLQMAQLGKE